MNIREKAGSFRAVYDFTRGIGSRREEHACALHFASGKDFTGARGGVKNGCDAQRECRDGFPILLRYQLIRALRAVGMGIDETRNDSFTFEVNRLGAARRGQVFTNLFNAVTLDENIRICLLYTSPSPRDLSTSRMPSSA